LTKFDKGHTDAVLGLAVSPDGKTLLSSDANGRVVRWEIATRKVLWMHETQTPKDTVAFSQDGSMFLVAGNDENVLVFRVDSDAPPRSCRSGSRILESAAFGSDGKSIAAVSDDAVLHLWTLDERCEILASAPLPLSAGSGAKAGNRTAHRRHIVFAAALGAFAVTASTSQVFVISPDPNAWLGRSVSLGEGGVRAPSN
jgi:WD40 repeat protein